MFCYKKQNKQKKFIQCRELKYLLISIELLSLGAAGGRKRGWFFKITILQYNTIFKLILFGNEFLHCQNKENIKLEIGSTLSVLN